MFQNIAVSVSIVAVLSPVISNLYEPTNLEKSSSQNDVMHSDSSMMTPPVTSPTIPPVKNKRLKAFFLEDCRLTQTEDSHHTKWGGHSYAIDMACEIGQSYDVKAPDFKMRYDIVWIWNDPLLGDFIVLRNWNERWVYGHTQTDRRVWESVVPGDVIWQSNASGHATNVHTHVEYWKGKSNMTFDGKNTNEFSEKLCDQRWWKFCQKKVNVEEEKYYFTHYDLWDEKQNDSSPCKWASGADLCWLSREWVNTMALTSDIRIKIGVGFGDKVILEWDAWCRGIYEVHDEMNARFREWCVKRPGTNLCIKGDLPWKPGGACTVKKITY